MKLGAIVLWVGLVAGGTGEQKDFGLGAFLLFVIPAALVAVIWWVSRDPCPRCTRRALGHRHARKDGGADRRYSFNPIVCHSCGWSAADDYPTIEMAEPAPRSVTVQVRFERAKEEERSEDEVLEEFLVRIVTTKGAAARRNAVAEGVRRLRTDPARHELLLRASRIEIGLVLNKVAALKTRQAKERHLLQAIETLKSDSVPDELQAHELSLLETALGDVRAQNSRAG